VPQANQQVTGSTGNCTPPAEAAAAGAPGYIAGHSCTEPLGTRGLLGLGQGSEGGAQAVMLHESTWLGAVIGQ
jgi:hypothetical protein